MKLSRSHVKAESLDQGNTMMIIHQTSRSVTVTQPDSYGNTVQLGAEITDAALRSGTVFD